MTFDPLRSDPILMLFPHLAHHVPRHFVPGQSHAELDNVQS